MYKKILFNCGFIFTPILLSIILPSLYFNPFFLTLFQDWILFISDFHLAYELNPSFKNIEFGCWYIIVPATRFQYIFKYLSVNLAFSINVLTTKQYPTPHSLSLVFLHLTISVFIHYSKFLPLKETCWKIGTILNSIKIFPLLTKKFSSSFYCMFIKEFLLFCYMLRWTLTRE